MKKIIIVLAVFISGLMIGFSANHSRAMSEACFKTLYNEKYGDVVYDIRTGVEYWRSDAIYNCGSLTLLVDENGRPLIYEGD